MKIDIPSNQLSTYHQHQNQAQPYGWQQGDVEYHASPAAGSNQDYDNTGDTPATEIGKGVMNMSFRMGKMEAADNL